LGEGKDLCVFLNGGIPADLIKNRIGSKKTKYKGEQGQSVRFDGSGERAFTLQACFKRNRRSGSGRGEYPEQRGQLLTISLFGVPKECKGGGIPCKKENNELSRAILLAGPLDIWQGETVIRDERRESLHNEVRGKLQKQGESCQQEGKPSPEIRTTKIKISGGGGRNTQIVKYGWWGGHKD